MEQATDLDLRPLLRFGERQHAALRDVGDALHLWRLSNTLAWLDIKLRYRGSVLGPFWLTISTAIMVAALGFLYSTLFHTDIHTYLPFLGLSLVLWGYIATLVGEACTAFTAVETTIRAFRMPLFVHATRTVWRNILVLGHNVVVIVVVFIIFSVHLTLGSLMALPGVALWVVDSLAVCLLLGAFCARFRDVPPIVASIMQIAFFVSPIIWQPHQASRIIRYLPINPFYVLMEVVRGPLLGEPTGRIIWASALIWSALLCLVSWLAFVRVRNRIAFWV